MMRAARYIGVLGLFFMTALWVMSLLWHARLTWNLNRFLVANGKMRLTLMTTNQRIPIKFELIRPTQATTSKYGLVLPSRYRGLFRNIRSYVIPIWLPTILFFIMAVCTLKLERIRRKFMHSNCHACRYNLTGNTSGICPECGITIPEETKKKRTTDLPNQ